MIVVEDEYAVVVKIILAADPTVTRAEVTICDILWNRSFAAADGFPAPRSVLAMRSDNHPLLAQRMPSFFPGAAVRFVFYSHFDSFMQLLQLSPGPLLPILSRGRSVSGCGAC